MTWFADEVRMHTNWADEFTFLAIVATIAAVIIATRQQPPTVHRVLLQGLGRR